MTALGLWLAYGVPWWIWAGVAGLAALALAHFVGVRLALVFAALATVLVAYRRGAQAGWQQHRTKEERDGQAAVDLAARARRAAERRDDDPVRLRDDDGWRRN